MKFAFTFGLVAIGFLLLVLSALWLHMFNGSSSWTLDKDKHWNEVKSRIKGLRVTIGAGESRSSVYGGPDLPKAKQDLESLLKENEELTAEFLGIQKRPHTVSTILRWTGISLAVLGIIGYYAANQQR